MNFKQRVKYLILCILICSSLFSCSFFNRPPLYIQKHFTHRYDGGNSGIDSLIAINGYYTIAKPNIYRQYDKIFSTKYKVVQDTFYMNYVFFKDGIFLWNMSFNDCDSPKCITAKLKKDGKDSLNRFYGNWGIYSVNGDTIIVQYIHKCSSLNDSWTAWESKFKVIDRKTILEFDVRPLYRKSKSELIYWENHKKGLKFEPANFIPTEILPASKTWLKKGKWIQKNKNNIKKDQ
jgi:hypothetical protein